SPLLKIALSALPFFILLHFYFFQKDKVQFSTYLLIYTFAYPFGPRELDSYQMGELLDYYSYTNLSVGVLSLSLFSLIFFTFLECQRHNMVARLIYNGLLFFGA